MTEIWVQFFSSLLDDFKRKHRAISFLLWPPGLDPGSEPAIHGFESIIFYKVVDTRDKRGHGARGGREFFAKNRQRK